MRVSFPFSAIVGQDEMKLALLIAAVDARIGGVMVFGDRGTGKSTAVRALAALLPPIPAGEGGFQDGTLRKGNVAVPFIDLPLGATEDRVVGALDLERALGAGEKAFERGCLRARMVGSSISMRSICSRTISSTCCSTWRRQARMSSNARG